MKITEITEADFKDPFERLEYLLGLTGLTYDDAADAWFKCTKLFPTLKTEHERLRAENEKHKELMVKAVGRYGDLVELLREARKLLRPCECPKWVEMPCAVCDIQDDIDTALGDKHE